MRFLKNIEDPIAERVAIETYREVVRYFGDQDPPSRVLLERFLPKKKSMLTN